MADLDVVEEILCPSYVFAYEMVRCVYQYIQIDVNLKPVKISESCERLFTEHFPKVLRILDMLCLPLTNFITSFDGTITEGSFMESVSAIIDMYKQSPYSEDKFLQMCTSIAICAFLSIRRGLEDSSGIAIYFIEGLTSEVRDMGTIQNSSWKKLTSL